MVGVRQLKHLVRLVAYFLGYVMLHYKPLISQPNQQVSANDRSTTFVRYYVADILKLHFNNAKVQSWLEKPSMSVGPQPFLARLAASQAFDTVHVHGLGQRIVVLSCGPRCRKFLLLLTTTCRPLRGPGHMEDSRYS